jgi:glutamyl-tRNA synthetase
MGRRPEDIVGQLACWAGLLERPEPVAARELVADFSWDRVKRQPIVVDHIL